MSKFVCSIALGLCRLSFLNCCYCASEARDGRVDLSEMAGALESAQDAIVFAYSEGLIDDEEFVRLYDQNNSTKVFPCWKFEPFNFDSWDDVECFGETPFTKADILKLMQCFGIPNRVICEQGTVCSGLEAFCIFLKRLAYPKKQHMYLFSVCHIRH